MLFEEREISGKVTVDLMAEMPRRQVRSEFTRAWNTLAYLYIEHKSTCFTQFTDMGGNGLFLPKGPDMDGLDLAE